jgi:menaquinone-dependent protoporphyrinogen IX oxidase
MAGKERGGKTLVVYYSQSGNTARVARDIAKRMGADLESIQDRHYEVGFLGYLKAVVDAVRGVSAVIDEPMLNPGDYALTIIGTPVWAGHMTPAVRAYLQKYQRSFGDVAFFVTSADTDSARIVPYLESLAKRYAMAFTGFSARELADQPTYEKRLSDFLKASVKGGRSPCVSLQVREATSGHELRSRKVGARG